MISFDAVLFSMNLLASGIMAETYLREPRGWNGTPALAAMCWFAFCGNVFMTVVNFMMLVK